MPCFMACSNAAVIEVPLRVNFDDGSTLMLAVHETIKSSGQLFKGYLVSDYFFQPFRF